VEVNPQLVQPGDVGAALDLIVKLVFQEAGLRIGVNHLMPPCGNKGSFDRKLYQRWGTLVLEAVFA